MVFEINMSSTADNQWAGLSPTAQLEKALELKNKRLQKTKASIQKFDDRIDRYHA